MPQEEGFARDLEVVRAVREHLETTGSKVLVADGEFDPDLDQVLDLAREGLLDVLLMDVLPSAPGFGLRLGG